MKQPKARRKVEPRAKSHPDGLRVIKEDKKKNTVKVAVPKSLEQQFRMVLAAIRSYKGPSKQDFFRPKELFTPTNIPKPWPGVVPKEYAKKTMVFDSAVSNMGAYASQYGGSIGFSNWDEAGFLGYAFLAQLSQITEFRRPAEIMANEMTRKWGKLVSSSEDESAKTKIKELTDDMLNFDIKGVYNKSFELDNFFGIGHLFPDFGLDDKRDELKSPLILDKIKIGKDSLKGFKTIEPMWTYPNVWNASDPLKDDFYSPKSWFVMGTEVHKSRLMRFMSRPMPDMLKPAYLFGGISLTQLMMPYVNNWLRTRQSVSSIISNFSTPVLKTDMDQMTTTAGAASLTLRGEIYNSYRDNQGLFICDMNKEDFEVVTTSLGNLSELQGQAIEQQAFPAGIPLVKLLGVTPSGLNASSDGEVRVFYDSIASVQERIGTPQMKKTLDILQLNRYQEIDPGITWEWAPLWELDEEKTALVRKTNAEVDLMYVEANIIDPQAIVDRINADPDSLYAGIDLGDPPDPMEMPGEPGEEGEPGEPNLSSLMGQMGAGKLVSGAEREKREAGEPREPNEREPNERDPRDNTARPARPAQTARTAEQRNADRIREKEGAK